MRLLLQAMKQLLSVLVIRRSREEVAPEHYTIPPQHHRLVEVQLRHCDSFVLRQLEKAARRVSSDCMYSRHESLC
jgi:hypothetical protein